MTQLYPSIDLRGGHVVRLRQGDYADETIYGDDAVAVATAFVEQGAAWIHVVDLDAARTGDPRNRPVGGCDHGCSRRTGAGADRRGSPVGRPTPRRSPLLVWPASSWDRPRCNDPAIVDEVAAIVPVAVGLDHRRGELAVHGWTEASGVALADAIDRFPAASAFVVTDIERDGLLAGPDVEGLAAVVSSTDVPVIASGGVGSLDDLAALGGDRRPPRDHHRSGAVRGPVHGGRGGRGTAVIVARVIPCLDVTAGRVVKGTNFVDLRDAGDPVELAARYDAEGADELVFLDITASSDARDTMVDVVYRTAEQVYIPFTVGGGIRTADDARRMLRAGADKVSVNTAAVQRPDADRRDRHRVRCPVRRLRHRRQAPAGRVRGLPARRAHTDGHRRRGVGGRRRRERGAGEILLTSMDRDGTREGFDLELTATVAGAVGVP